jgi:thiol-disulfide isomerase/thioredoxin
MPFPSYKSTLVFVAGFASCLLCLAVLTFGGYYFCLEPAATGQNVPAQSLLPPAFPSSQPAEFNFRIIGTNNMPVDFRDYRGRVIILNFWATWCPPCQLELPRLGQLAGHYAALNDVAVVCVSGESPAMVFKNPPAAKSGAPLFAIAAGAIPRIYQSDILPATFIIDKKGMIVFQCTGPADWSAASVIKFVDSLR